MSGPEGARGAAPAGARAGAGAAGAGPARADADGDAAERDGRDAARAALRRRLAWFGGLWLGGVLCLGAVAYGIRAWLGL